MQDWLIPIRWIHVAAASAWFGEVVVINFVLIPVLAKYDAETLKRFLTTVFPRIFTLASVLSLTAVISGAALVYLITDGDLALLTEGRWGLSILIGGSIGLALTLFHFLLENRLARGIGLGRRDISDEAITDVHAKLKTIPRLGLGVITATYVLMMFAVRGV